MKTINLKKKDFRKTSSMHPKINRNRSLNKFIALTKIHSRCYPLDRKCEICQKPAKAVNQCNKITRNNKASKSKLIEVHSSSLQHTISISFLKFSGISITTKKHYK